VFELPIESFALQSPFLMHVALLVVRALSMLFNGCTIGELVATSSTSQYRASVALLATETDTAAPTPVTWVYKTS